MGKRSNFIRMPAPGETNRRFLSLNPHESTKNRTKEEKNSGEFYFLEPEISRKNTSLHAPRPDTQTGDRRRLVFA